MDEETRRQLARLIRGQRVAALGTLHEATPLVTAVLYAAAPDFSAFFIHVSRLALHTQALRQDPRVSLLVAEPDTGANNPLALARVSLRGEASERALDAADYEAVKRAYLAKFPEAAINFSLPDFSLYAIVPAAARYVAGFGRIHDLTAADFALAAQDRA
jgi:heme iron utilization protein